MNRHLLISFVFVLVLAGPIFGPALSKVEGAIVYSGSQNVTLQLKGGPNLPAPPAEMAMISIAGASDKWDDFTIILEYEMAMAGMTMGKTRLTILGSKGMTMGMGEVVGMDMLGMGTALNLASGVLIGPDSPIADSGQAVLLSEGQAGRTINGEFDESGGYIGLVLPGSTYYGWLHLANMSNVGANNQSVTFDGWAYEDVAGMPIGAGDTISEPGPCDWQPGDPYKMHFPQLPDAEGWDVDVTAANLLADDWKCSETGPVEDIHFWYSWQGDKVGMIDYIYASIYSNIPAADSATRYSIPGKLLWEGVFGPADFNLRYWATGKQGFIMGGQGKPNDHKNIYQCNICNIPYPFIQQAGQIYWLVLSITIRDPVGTHIGWKTSLEHFEDDAVYDAGGRWVELRDPQTQKSLDLAFVITGEEVPESGIKWAQRPEVALCNMPPGCFYGWDELSIFAGSQIVADDWLCSDDRPITDIHWWGSFKSWASEKAPPQMPDGFHIAIWTDVPAGTDQSFSHPGKVIWQTYCKNYTYKFVGWDVDPHDMAPPWETTFYFEYDLPEAEWFWQDPSAQIYWLSIEAVYSTSNCACLPDMNCDGVVDGKDIAPFDLAMNDPAAYQAQYPDCKIMNGDADCDGDIDLADRAILMCLIEGRQGCCSGSGPINYPWGWKTRRRDPASAAPDDAVIIFKPTNPSVGDTFQDGKPIYWPTPDRSWDMAFVLTTAEVQPEEPKCDLGDAPDSSNTAGVQMTAYPKGGPLGVQANYPTVYGVGSPPYGPIHWQPKAVAYLGDGVSLENEADFGPDEDGTNNIDPSNDSPDLDKADDGVAVPLVLPHCGQTSFDYRVTVVPLATIEPPPLYVNVWFDWNRDGDWNDVLLCPDGTQVPEWAVQNQLLQFVTSGTYDVTTPEFTCWHPSAAQTEDPIWMRITLSEKQWGMVISAARASGDGPAAGYEYGETEDYYFVPEVPPEPKPPAEHLKWSQPPVEWEPTSKTPYYCGWDEPSFAIRPSSSAAVPPIVWNIVADDFHCLGSMPVTSVHWWGSYQGWDGSGTPTVRPTFWRIGFWSNVPADPSAKPGYSYPRKLLWLVDVPAERVQEERAGFDRFPQNKSDTCFRYSVKFEPKEYFWQQKYINSATGDDVFWISITAIYPPVTIPFQQWGWKTRPQHWMDDAVKFVVEGDLPLGYANDSPLIFTPIEAALCEQQESFDMAFELDTDPNYIKWEQAYTGIRDWPHYEDEESLATDTVAEIKWTQEPDISETGIDVDATDDIPTTWPLQVLADDFKCTTTGPITHIRLWASWYSDILPAQYPENVVFKLGIYKDIPASQSQTGYSMPGELLWSRDFKSSEFDATKYVENLKEGWYVPCKSVYETSADTVCWQFDFDIDRSEAFIQQQGTIYWLQVQAQVTNTPGTAATRFGWKTSADHWNDDGVWSTEVMPISRPWEELRYPKRHPLEGKSIDLAFEITSETQKELLQIRRLVADDWLCTRITPVSAVVWWGSYMGYRYQACQCQQMTPPVKPDYFLLSIWSDVPTSSNVPFSHPGEKVWEYKANDYDEVLVGYDKKPEMAWPSLIGTVEPGQTPGHEPVFRYSVRLPKENWFCQKNVNDVYWLSIVAVYKDPKAIVYPWGWTNHKCTTWQTPTNPAFAGAGPAPAEAGVLHWKLDETSGLIAGDDSGNNNHGTLVGDANWAACCGHVCGALDLDGKGDYVKVDTPTGLNFAPGSFSASAWVSARQVSGGWQTIMEYDRDGWERNRFGMWLTEDGRFHFRVGWNAWQTNQKLNADQWYMLTGTYDSSTKKFSMFVNGQFDVAADLQKGFTSANVAKLTVGVRGSEDDEYFNGLIDDVRIYNYALSADQVKALYDASRNDDAVAGHMVIDPAGDRPSPTLVVWEELRDQLGMSEDMSFILFTEPGCFPCTYSTYGDWLAFGKPNCWCAKPNGSGYQCDGDADGKDSGGINKFRVFTGDLNLIVANWKKKAGDATLDPCADIDHKDSGGINKYRVFTGDLTILVTNWRKKDAHLPGDCPRPE